LSSLKRNTPKFQNTVRYSEKYKDFYSEFQTFRALILQKPLLILAGSHILSLSRFNEPNTTPHLEGRGHNCIYVNKDSVKTKRWWGSVSFWFLSPFIHIPGNFTFPTALNKQNIK